MAGPWEEYQQRGPWDDYADPGRTGAAAENIGNLVGGGVPDLGPLAEKVGKTALPALNKGIANMLGMPVEIVNSVLRAVGIDAGGDEPVGGIGMIRRGMESVGINTKPREDTLVDRVISKIAEGAGAGAVFGPAGLIPGAVSGAGAFAGGEAGEAVGGQTGRKIGEVAGGVGVGLVPSAAKAIGKSMAPKFPEETAMLERGGVKLTPMTKAGGEFQRAEQGMTSAAIAGRGLKTQIEQMEDSFVTATINRALSPIGEKLSPGTKAGHEAIDEMITVLSNAYDDILPQLKVIRGPQFDADVATTLAAAIPGTGKLARQARQKFSDIFNNRVIDKFDNLGTMSGAQFKEADSVLGKSARQYLRADDPQMQEIGEALKGAQIALRNMVARNNPELADDLNRINQAYAMSLRVERAADAARHNGGRFTPGQLETAVTSRASATARESARGKAVMQDWAKAAERVMARQVPDSGTPFRTLVTGAAARPLGFAQGTLGAYGFNAGMNAALDAATSMSRIKTKPEVPIGFGASLMMGQ